MSPPRKAITPAPDDLITAAEVAELLRCTVNALYVRRNQKGDGPPAYRIGRRLLWSRSEVLSWVAEHREGDAA